MAAPAMSSHAPGLETSSARHGAQNPQIIWGVRARQSHLRLRRGARAGCDCMPVAGGPLGPVIGSWPSANPWHRATASPCWKARASWFFRSRSKLTVGSWLVVDYPAAVAASSNRVKSGKCRARGSVARSVPARHAYGRAHFRCGSSAGSANLAQRDARHRRAFAASSSVQSRHYKNAWSLVASGIRDRELDGEQRSRCAPSFATVTGIASSRNSNSG